MAPPISFQDYYKRDGVQDSKRFAHTYPQVIHSVVHKRARSLKALSTMGLNELSLSR